MVNLMGTKWLKIGTKRIKLLLVFGLLVFSTISIAEVTTQCIELNWTAPTEREDETLIQAIEKYNLYQTHEGILLPTIEIDRAATSYSTCNVQTGIHLFQITTVELDGVEELESQRSPEVNAAVYPDPQAPPRQIVLTIRVIVSTESDNITATAAIVE